VLAALGEHAHLPRDPALDAPRFAPVFATTFIEPREPVIELTVGGETRAYPLQILIWHEIVNDELGWLPVAVTFCPLCNTAIAFDRRVEGRTLDFGTTGKLRHSDLVMYDRQTESWWQQFGGDDCETRGRRAAYDLSGDWPLCVVDLCRYGVESKIQNVCLLLCHAIADGDHRFRFTSPVTPTSRSPTDGVG